MKPNIVYEERDETFDVKFEAFYGVPIPIPPYSGEYEVEPAFYEQILQTKNKSMTDDVSVHAIEVQRVSNPKGGLTVYIGGNING